MPRRRDAEDIAATDPRGDDPAGFRRYLGVRGAALLGFAAIGATVVGFASWAFTAPIGSAVVVQGIVKPQGNRKKVQHLDGGVVKRIEVRGGSVVKAGDVLLVLDEVQTRARLAIIEGAVQAAEAAQARLLAERDGLDKVTFPAARNSTAGSQSSSNRYRSLAIRSPGFRRRRSRSSVRPSWPSASSRFSAGFSRRG